MYRFICLLFFLPFALFAAVPKPLVVLDAGHGGLDVGAKIRYPYCEEKKMALLTTQLTKKYLEQMGYRVVMTRSSDFFVPLKKRVTIANKSPSKAFVSVHFNSCPNKIAHGIEIFYCNYSKNKKRNLASRKLAENVLARTTTRTQSISRGVKRGNFVVVRDTSMPSILIEGGFITNPKERDKLRQRQHLDKLAKGIAEGLDRFVKTS